jgi:hypothetical protein
MIRRFAPALAVAFLLAPVAAEAQTVKFKATPAMYIIGGECRAETISRGVTADQIPVQTRICIKARTKPFRKACNKDAKSRGYVKRTAEFKDFVHACVGAQLAALYPTAPASPPRPPANYSQTSPSPIYQPSDEDEDMFFGEEE